jgi:hypothetical protein
MICHLHDIWTDIGSAPQAHVTFPATDSGLDRDSVPDLEVLDIRSNLQDLPSGFMTQYDIVGHATITDSPRLPATSSAFFPVLIRPRTFKWISLPHIPVHRWLFRSVSCQQRKGLRREQHKSQEDKWEMIPLSSRSCSSVPLY